MRKKSRWNWTNLMMLMTMLKRMDKKCGHSEHSALYAWTSLIMRFEIEVNDDGGHYNQKSIPHYQKHQWTIELLQTNFALKL